MLRLGLIASEKQQLKSLHKLVSHTAHSIATENLVAQCSLPLSTDVDCWVFRVADHNDQVERLLDWFDQHDVPLVIEDLMEDTSGNRDELVSLVASRNLSRKIATAVSSVDTRKRKRRVPEKVWALGASAGGPEAVIGFFKALPVSASKHAFVYAQHIDESGFPHLVRSLEKQSKLAVKVCCAGMPIEAGTIYVVPLAEEMNIEVASYFAVSGEEWKGPYKPSIDQVLAKVAKAFRKRSGVIIFSGMGNDGASALKMVRASGASIYAQSPESCAVDAMPNSAIETGCVELIADVDALAQAFSE